MKYLIITILFSTSFLFAQDEKSISKFERFISETGSLTRVEHFNLPDIVAYSEKLKNKVIVIHSLDEKAYFYQISKSGKYKDKKATITKDDLSEIIRALLSLIKESENIKTESDYMESKFTTEDGFRVGFAISNGGITWFITLEKYGSDSSVLFKNYNQLSLSLHTAKKKIDELRSNSD